MDLARNGNTLCAKEILWCTKATFNENPYEIEIIGVILGCVLTN